MGAAIKKLVDHWKTYDPDRLFPKFHLKDEKEIEATAINEIKVCSVEAYLNAHNLENIHAALQPVPYVGNLETADLFLLMINPSVALGSYGTQSKTKFQEELKKERHQARSCCLALDPAFWWTSWFTYYDNLFKPSFKEMIKKTGKTYHQTLLDAASRTAILELVPYFSGSAQSVRRIESRLVSTRLAKQAAKEICEKANKGDATVVIRWSEQDQWGLRDFRSEYIQRSECRNGLSKKAREVILERLKSSYKSQ